MLNYIFPCSLTDRLHVNTHGDVLSRLVCPAGQIDIVHRLQRSCRNLGAARESGQLLIILLCGSITKPVRMLSLPELVEILLTFTNIASDIRHVEIVSQTIWNHEESFIRSAGRELMKCSSELRKCSWASAVVHHHPVGLHTLHTPNESVFMEEMEQESTRWWLWLFKRSQ